MFETILVPTDGSEHAARAAEHGRDLARAFDATVHVVSVVDVQGAAGRFDAGGVDEAFVERLEARSEEALSEVEGVFDGDVRTAVLRGEVVPEILEYAAAHDAGLLAMGTHGRTGLDRYMLGSVTERVVRRADVPVLTVRATERSRATGRYEEVLVPTDGSEWSEAAVDPALAIAREAGARVHALCVVNVADLGGGPDSTLPPEAFDYLESGAEEAVEQVADRAREAGLEAVTDVRYGTPARTLLRYAEQSGIDLVAMGTAGQTGPSRYLLGSTTERVVRHADVPVLAVNARGERE
ncbi:MAG: universal stress protein [Haloarculaceae archaeon]